MNKGRPANQDTLSLLRLLKVDLHETSIVNLQQWFNDWRTDAVLATILPAIGIVEKVGGKNDGCWEWTAEEPDEEMAELVRETAREYKYAE